MIREAMPRSREFAKSDVESGMVTVEMAMALASLLAVFALLIGGISAVRTHAQLCQGAREAARLVAVGESAQAATQALPPRAKLSVGEAGRWVEATVSAPFAGALGLGTLSCSVKTLAEPVGHP